MSDLPPGYSDVPPGASGPREPGVPYSEGPPFGPDPGAIKNRVRGPAIFLIVVGSINLLFALWQLVEGGMLLTKTPAEVHDETVQSVKMVADAFFKDPDMHDKIVEAVEKQDAQSQYNQGLMQTFGSGVVWGILSLLTLFGAFRMMALRGYGLAVTGAIIAAIPIVSCPGACCFIGEIAGIWALVVLLNNEVRSAFR